MANDTSFLAEYSSYASAFQMILFLYYDFMVIQIIKLDSNMMKCLYCSQLKSRLNNLYDMVQ